MAILKIWDGSSWVKVGENTGEDTKVVAGTYTGNDTLNRFIYLGFTPKYVLLMGGYLEIISHNVAGLSLGWYRDYIYVNDDGLRVVIVTNGFKVGAGSIKTNAISKKYHYVAIG